VSLQISVDVRMSNKEINIITDTFGNNLYTTYYPGNSDTYPISNFGVMIFHGMAEDQRSFDLFASKFQRLWMDVFCTDFSGHGRSTGVMPMGENGDSILADQVNKAKMKFQELSHLNDSQIFMIGHSFGARAILSSQLTESSPVNGCILIGPAVYLDFEFGEDLEDNLSPANPNTNIFILVGDLEDICPPNYALRLYQKLTNDTSIDTPENVVFKTTSGLTRELRILKWLTHTNEAFSFRTVQLSALWIQEIILGESHIQSNSSYFAFEDFRVYFSILEIIGVLLSLIYSYKTINLNSVENKNEEIMNLKISDSKIINPKKYFLVKIPILLGCLGISAVIGFLLVLLPIGTPIFSLLYFCPLTGYGILLLILYKTNRMPGYKGKWKARINESFKSINWINVIIGLLILGSITLLLAYFFNGYMYTFFPGNVKVIWLFILLVLSPIGFYVLQIELEEIKITYPENPKYLFLNYFIFLLPYIAGSLSVFLFGYFIFIPDAINNIVLLAIVLLMGNLLQQIWKKPLFTALAQSFLFFFLLLPRGQLMAFFM